MEDQERSDRGMAAGAGTGYLPAGTCCGRVQRNVARSVNLRLLTLPEGWAIAQKLTTVDASTFQVYLTNLKPLFVEMVRGCGTGGI